MVHKYIKLGLSIILFGFSIYLMFFTRQMVLEGVLVLLLALAVLFLFFRNEYIILAFFQIRKQNMEGAKKWLDKIQNPPSKLIKTQEGYYYLLNGMIESQANFGKAESLFRKALNTGLLMGHDKAMAKMNLAIAAASKGRKNEANQLIKEAEKLDTRGMISDQIKMIKGQIKKVQTSRNPNMQRMQRGGGGRSKFMR